MALRPLNLFLGAVDKVTEPIDRVHRKIERLSDPLKKINRQVGRLVEKSGLGRFGRSLATATRRAVRLGAALGRVTRNLGLIAGGLGVAAALQLRSVAEAGDAIAKQADRIGVSVEFLQELRFGAERAGADVTVLDRSLEGFAKRIGEAKAGTGSLVTLLQKVNPALLEQFKATRTTEEAFLLLADSIQATEDQTLRLALANAAAGRQGGRLLNLLQEGRAGIDAYARRARELGIIISEDQARASEVFVDSMTDLRLAILGVRNVVGGDLIPTVTRWIDLATDWVVANRDLVTNRVDRVLQAIPPLFRQVVSTGREVVDALRPIVETSISIAKAIGPTKTILIALGVVVAAIVLPPLVALVGAIATIGSAIAGVVGIPALLTAGLYALAAGAAVVVSMLANRFGPAIEEWLLGIPTKALAIWDSLIAKIKGVTSLGIGSIGRFFGLGEQTGPPPFATAAAQSGAPAGGVGPSFFGNAGAATVKGGIRVDVVDPGGRARVSTTSEGDVALELETGPTGGAIP